MKKTFLMVLSGFMATLSWAQSDVFVNNIFEDVRFSMHGDYRWTHGTTTSDGCFVVSHDYTGTDYNMEAMSCPKIGLHKTLINARET